MSVHLRTVDRFVASGRPAGALRQTIGVVGIADENSAALLLLLEVTFQAEHGAAFGQHSRVHGAVRRVAADTAFLQRFMLENERSALCGVTLETSVVLTKQQSSAAFDLLRQTCSSAFDGAAGVRIVTIRAAYLAFQYRMVMRHFKSGAHFKMTLETRVR